MIAKAIEVRIRLDRVDEEALSMNLT